MNLTDNNFDSEIQNSKVPVLVDFFANWCEPCKMLAPILENIEKEMEGKFVLAKANLDETPLVAQKFQVEKIPTVVLFKEGKPVSGFVGLAQPQQIKDWLSDLLK
jgi:thioredoxin 1